MADKTCATCRFRDEFQRCRRWPPVRTKEMQIPASSGGFPVLRGSWPVVSDTDWCGEWSGPSPAVEKDESDQRASAVEGPLPAKPTPELKGLRVFVVHDSICDYGEYGRIIDIAPPTKLGTYTVLVEYSDKRRAWVLWDAVEAAGGQ